MDQPLTDIDKAHNHDVLSGRGNNINAHAGNKYFRSLVNKLKVEYVATQKAEKGMFAKLIVTQIRGLNPPGRFLKQNPKTGLWDDIGEKKAVDKTRQALREDAPKIEEQLKKGELSVQSHVMARLIADQARSVYEQMSGEDSSHGDLSQQNFNIETPSYDPQFAPVAPVSFAHGTNPGVPSGPNVSSGPSGGGLGRPHFRDIHTGHRISVSRSLYSSDESQAGPLQTSARSGWMANSLYIPGGLDVNRMSGQSQFSLQDANRLSTISGSSFVDPNRLSTMSSNSLVDPNRMSSLSLNNSLQFGQFPNMHASGTPIPCIPNQMPTSNVPVPAPTTESEGMAHRFVEALAEEDSDDDGGNMSDRGNHSPYDDGPAIRNKITLFERDQVGSEPFLGGSSEDQNQEEIESVQFPGSDSNNKPGELEVGSEPFPGTQPEGHEQEVGSESFPGAPSGYERHEQQISSEPFPGDEQEVGILPFSRQSEDQKQEAQSLEPEDTFDQDMRVIHSSFRTSLNIKDVFDRNAPMGHQSMAHQSRMSLCSRRSSCMSMILRSSFLSSLESDEEERIRQSVNIPDVFKSKRDRRKSVLTESTTQLLSTVFGEETAGTAKSKHGRESILLRDALQPISSDEFMMSLGDFSVDDFANSDMHMSQFMDQSAQEISKYVDSLAEGERRRMSRQFKMESIKSASERTLTHSNAAGDMDQSMSDLFEDERKALS